jgi:hypothetical protein
MGAIIVTLVPGQPLSVRDWPLQGVFGIFTWATWFSCTGLAFTLVLLALALRIRPMRDGVISRVWIAALLFGALASAAFAAAARADLIERYPALALIVSIGVLFAVRQGFVRLRDVVE